MSGSGARDGGSPPWGPAEPVPGRQPEEWGQGARFQPGDADEDPPADSPSGQGGKRRRSFWRELPVLIVIALVLAFVIKSFVVQAFWIPSGSMENTLEVNDRVLVNKIVYHLRPIHRGDIVVFDGTGSWDFGPPADSNIFSKAVSELEGIVGISHDSAIYIKRVIGLPGDHVVCCNTRGQVTVNGVPLSESSYLYPDNVPSQQKFSITVPPGRLWVMGDHRDVSYDSRGHQGDPGGGTIPESGVLGRAFVIIWPPSRVGFLNIPATFEQPQLNASTANGANAAASAAAGGSAAALESALGGGTPIRPASSPLPLALGFAGAVPLTWLQRRVRVRRRNRRRNRRSELPGPRQAGAGAARARGGVRCGVRWSLPRIPPDKAPGSPPMRTPWRVPGWRPSPASTRLAAARARAHWWSRRSCSTRPRSSASRDSRTPSC
jgi:signal peptidase I